MKTSVAVLHLVLRSKFRLSGKVQHVIIASTLRLRVSLNIKVTICATRDANIELRDVLFVRRDVGHIFPNLEEPASYEFSSPTAPHQFSAFFRQCAFAANYSRFSGIIPVIGGEISHAVPGRLHTSKEKCQVKLLSSAVVLQRGAEGLEDAVSIFSDEG